MTEQEWLETSDPADLLRSSLFRPNARRFRLFVVYCCQQDSEAFPHPRDRRVIQIAEQLADGQAGEADRVSAEQILFEMRADLEVDVECAFLIPLCLVARELDAEDALSCARDMALRAEFMDGRFKGMEVEMYHEQAVIIRDLFGNPFRLVAFDPRWRTSDVLGLARAIYEDRAFDRMPILADALMDAGCADDQVLAHCRGDGPHVRGCWVVDLVLGKE
jgi:hypothetical protein